MLNYRLLANDTWKTKYTNPTTYFTGLDLLSNVKTPLQLFWTETPNLRPSTPLTTIAITKRNTSKWPASRTKVKVKTWSFIWNKSRPMWRPILSTLKARRFCKLPSQTESKISTQRIVNFLPSRTRNTLFILGVTRSKLSTIKRVTKRSDASNPVVLICPSTR